MYKNIYETKNFPASSREWKNSMYSYNESNLINAPHNDAVANSMMNMVFHLARHEKANTKSKRMRDLIRRNSTRQLLVSKPDIKQTNDKAIITIYVFDRERTLYTRKLYFIKNSLYKSSINNTYVHSNLGDISFNQLESNDISNIDNIPHGNITKLIKLKGKLLDKIVKAKSNKRLNNNMRKLFSKKLSYKYKINKTLITRTMYNSILNKKNMLGNLFMFKFLKWVMSYFGINVFYVKAGKLIPFVNIKGKSDTLRFKNSVLMLVNNYGKYINNKRYVFDMKNYTKFITIPNVTSILKVRFVNKLLLSYVRIMITNYVNNNVKNKNINNTLYKVYSLYKNKYLTRYAMFYLRKQKLTLSYLVKLYNNKLKYNSLSHAFKSLLSNVYNKDIKLNIVNLKYLHLNSDIFSEAVSIKLRKKNNKLLTTLKLALKLIKMPKIVSHNPNIQNISKLNSFNWYGVESNSLSSKHKFLGTESMGNMIDSLLFGMFPNEVKYSKHELAHNILYSIKHKWVRGARLEAKGRLTKRYTASRSLFKLRYKGSLKNLEHLKKASFTKEQVSLSMLRNATRPNIQYTLTTSRKRIGVYGIKGWISGY